MSKTTVINDKNTKLTKTKGKVITLEENKAESPDVYDSLDRAHRTLTVKQQLIDEEDNLWGFVVETNGVKKRVDSLKLMSMMNYQKIPVVVDWSGKDAPATLTIVHKRTTDGMIWFFRTIGDRYKKNNLANVPKLKSQSSHLRKMARIK